MRKDEYDVIIIGAGIGGLACGCYLAKAGMKVLLIEKNDNVGGYCSSFEREGFNFDACVHSLGSCGENSNLGTVLRELGLIKRIELKRYDPSDTIICSDYKINIRNNFDHTIEEFQKSFPSESYNIKNFFTFINGADFTTLFVKYKNRNFQYLLDEYFSNNQLKSLISVFLLGYAGLPSSLISAASAVVIYRGNILDGGYYPIGGMQVFSNNFAEMFKEFGGQLFLSQSVEKIIVDNNMARGVVVGKNNFISSKYVVSNCDARETFLNLIKEQSIGKGFQSKITSMIPSLSAFSVYLGVKKGFVDEKGYSGANLWILYDYNIDGIYNSIVKKDKENKYCLSFFPSFHDAKLAPKGNDVICLFVNAPYVNKTYWEKNRNIYLSNILKNLEKFMGGLSSSIIIRETATPHTLNKYTLNYKGSAFGWDSIPSQFALRLFTKDYQIQRLYLVGHWTTLGHGIPMVAYNGRKTANLILKEEEKNA